MRFAKATGTRGSWFARVDGESHPCVHKHWVQRDRSGMTYVDPGYDPERAIWGPFIEALETQKRAVLTEDQVSGTDDRNLSFSRTGYIALYAIDHVQVDENVLRFDFVERLRDLKA